MKADNVTTQENIPQGSNRPTIPGLQLTISTELGLDPELTDVPYSSSRKPKVHLAVPPDIATTVSTDPKTGEKVLKRTMNLHPVAFGAIRLFAIEDSQTGAFSIKTIEINPAVLLFDDPGHPLTPIDVARALTRLQLEVTPLLAKPEDAQHIVPGVAEGERCRASWCHIASTVTFIQTPLYQCHKVAHPGTGPVEGATPKCLRVGTKGDDLIITLDSVSEPFLAEAPGNPTDVPGIRATVSLKGRDMIKHYRHGGGTSKIGDYFRLTRFGASTLASVHEEILSELEGTYLIPSERPAKGRALTPAKVIAWMSATTFLSVEQLIARYMEIGSPSKSTLKRLKQELKKELGRIMPLPLSSRFRSEFHAQVATGSGSPEIGDVDPLIAKLYA